MVYWAPQIITLNPKQNFIPILKITVHGMYPTDLKLKTLPKLPTAQRSFS